MKTAVFPQSQGKSMLYPKRQPKRFRTRALKVLARENDVIVEDHPMMNRAWQFQALFIVNL